jgi:hypothetical protein
MSASSWYLILISSVRHILCFVRDRNVSWNNLTDFTVHMNMDIFYVAYYKRSLTLSLLICVNYTAVTLGAVHSLPVLTYVMVQFIKCLYFVH